MQVLALLPPGSLSPLLLSLVMAAWDVATRRIPNFLTFGGALAGLMYHLALQGWQGLWFSLGGLTLGLVLLLPPYALGGMGAGDVKALAALGAWLGPKGILSVFCFMGLAGGILSLGVLLFTGRLWQYLRSGWYRLLNLILLRGQRRVLVETVSPGQEKLAGIPYGVAIALGMLVFLRWGSLL